MFSFTKAVFGAVALAGAVLAASAPAKAQYADYPQSDPYYDGYSGTADPYYDQTYDGAYAGGSYDTGAYYGDEYAYGDPAYGNEAYAGVCDYYDPPWGYPPDYCNYQLYYEPVYLGGSWYSGPFYYRNFSGVDWFWLNGGWRRNEWRGARPRIDWNRGGNRFWRGEMRRGGNFAGRGGRGFGNRGFANNGRGFGNNLGFAGNGRGFNGNGGGFAGNGRGRGNNFAGANGGVGGRGNGAFAGGRGFRNNGGAAVTPNNNGARGRFGAGGTFRGNPGATITPNSRGAFNGGAGFRGGNALATRNGGNGNPVSNRGFGGNNNRFAVGNRGMGGGGNGNPVSNRGFGGGSNGGFTNGTHTRRLQWRRRRQERRRRRWRQQSRARRTDGTRRLRELGEDRSAGTTVFAHTLVNQRPVSAGTGREVSQEGLVWRRK